MLFQAYFCLAQTELLSSEGKIILQTSPLAVLILESFFEDLFGVEGVKLSGSFVQLGDSIPNSSQILSPVKRLLCKLQLLSLTIDNPIKLVRTFFIGACVQMGREG